MGKFPIILLLFSAGSAFAQGPVLEGTLLPTSMGTSGGELKAGWDWGPVTLFASGSQKGILQENQSFRRGSLSYLGDISRKTTTGTGGLNAALELGPFSFSPQILYLYETAASKTNAHEVDAETPDSYGHFTEINESEVRMGPLGVLDLGFKAGGFQIILGAGWGPWMSTSIENRNYDGLPVWLAGKTYPEYAWTKNIFSYSTMGSELRVQGALSWDFWDKVLSAGLTGKYSLVTYGGSSRLESTTWRGVKAALDAPLVLVPGDYSYDAAFRERRQELELGISLSLLMIRQAFPNFQTVPTLSVSWISTNSQSNTDPKPPSMITATQWIEAVQYFRFGVRWGL